MDTLIIHNADFDIGFINNELKLLDLSPLQNKFIDTVFLARKKLNTRIVNLDHLCRRFSIDLSNRKFHGALLDCKLLSEVYLRLLGGRQISLELVRPPNNKTSTEDKRIIKESKVHEIPISIEEIRQHKDFVANLKNSLWYKINY